MQRKKTNLSKFQKTVWDFYKEHKRDFLPWRKTKNPYKILVSEIMLQQTQVDRVIPKYKSFLKKFPTIKSLSDANLRALLIEWQGLGYNRRALNLKKTAEIIHNDFNDKFPTEYVELIKLPGIGKATAGDILAFAFNKPSVVIETNIRTVFIHHYFMDKENVTDKELEVLIEETLDKENPRDWYYALMDYGTHLKKNTKSAGNNIHKSSTYKKQSPFKGSNRELRSNILKLVLKKPYTKEEILKLLDKPADKINLNLIALEKEGLIKKQNHKFTS